MSDPVPESDPSADALQADPTPAGSTPADPTPADASTDEPAQDDAPAIDALAADALPTETVRAIEAILMVSDRPVEAHLLAQVTETAPERIEALLDELAAGYEVDGRGFILTKVAGGYRYQSHPDLAPYVERFVLEGQTARLSSAALETLAIVAYKQPLSRAQVAAIRGVNVDGVLRTLEQRGYVAEVGRDPGPGNPILFGTTDVFLEKMGLGSVDDLPPIAEFMPGSDVVEALEHGLRAEPDEPDVPAEGGVDGPGAAPPAASDDDAADDVPADVTAEVADDVSTDEVTDDVEDLAPEAVPVDESSVADQPIDDAEQPDEVVAEQPDGVVAEQPVGEVEPDVEPAAADDDLPG